MKVFAKIECDLPDNEKIMKAGALCELLYVRGLLFCKERLTDGVIPAVRLAKIAAGIPGDANEHAAKLVQVGLWTTTPDGWDVPGWKDRNKSKAEVEAEREVTSEKRRSAANTRWKRDAKPDANLHANEHAKQVQGAVQNECKVDARVQSTEYRDNSTLSVTYVTSLASGDAGSGKALPNESKLDELLDGWNALPEGFAPRVAKRRSDTIERLWRSAQSSRDLRDALADVPTLMASIRASPKLDRRTCTPTPTWFDFAWLFGRGSANKELNAVKILNGNYQGEPINASRQRQFDTGAGQTHQGGESGGLRDWSAGGGGGEAA